VTQSYRRDYNNIFSANQLACRELTCFGVKKSYKDISKYQLILCYNDFPIETVIPVKVYIIGKLFEIQFIHIKTELFSKYLNLH